MKHVLIFKTNVESEEQLQQAAELLDSNYSILKWNIDRDDIDNVLRIESRHSNTDDIMKVMVDAGFLCEELTD